MAKETIKERKCKVCSQILPKKSRSDRKTCSDYCRKQNSLIATVGDTEYKKHEVSKEAKDLYNSIENEIQSLRHIQWLILVTDTTENTTETNYKELFKDHTIQAIDRLMERLKDLSIDILSKVNISEIQEILDELDDRDNDRNENLYF